MNRVASALAFVPAHERDVWVAMAMAVKSELGDAGFQLWDDWSQTAGNYNALSARSVWKSCRGSGVTIASLFHEAKLHGWRDEGYQKPSQAQIDAQRRASEDRQSKEGRERIRSAQEAAQRAQWILGQCKTERHAYLDAKGFRELDGLVWRRDEETNLLCIPMYVGRELAGIQMIDRNGGKKFLAGQVTSKAEFRIDSGALSASDWWVEGYASGLSLRACLHALKLRYCVHITFSAGNLRRMAHSGYVIADNDASNAGLNAATDTGLPFWMPPNTGDDINDVHRKSGTFRTSQMLGAWLKRMRDDQEWYASDAMT